MLMATLTLVTFSSSMMNLRPPESDLSSVFDFDSESPDPDPLFLTFARITSTLLSLTRWMKLTSIPSNDISVTSIESPSREPRLTSSTPSESVRKSPG